MKKIYFILNDEGYIDGGISYGKLGGNAQSIEIDDNHEIFSNDPEAFKYEDGKLVFDEKKKDQLMKEQEKNNSKIPKEERNEMAMLELANLVAELKGEL